MNKMVTFLFFLFTEPAAYKCILALHCPTNIWYDKLSKFNYFIYKWKVLWKIFKRCYSIACM